jgi:hypothetical protein
MIAAAHLDKFLFLLFIAVAIFFQLLTRAANKGGRRGGDDQNRRSTPLPQTPRSARHPPEQTEEDRVRKFLEALGQPTTSKPPSPVVRHPTYQKPVVLPKRVFRNPYQLPPLTTRPPDLPETPTFQRPAPERKVVQPKAEPPAFEADEGPPPLRPITEVAVAGSLSAMPQLSSKPVETKTDVRSLLRTPSGLRDAIILREIFGPPRSLQPLDLVGNV